MFKKISDSIIEISSNIPGKTTTIMAGVHGNELSGLRAVENILKTINVISGKVYFITANLKALAIKQRQFEKNLNRCFLSNNQEQSYEDNRAREIMPYLQNSDYLLDVHNTTNQENSVPFLISEHKELGKYFDVNLVVSWFDKLHPGGSDGYMNSLGKIWLCLESGSIYDSNGPKLAEKSILNFLRFTKNIAGEANIHQPQKFIKFTNIYKNKTLDFKFSKQYKDFEEIEANTIIAYDREEKIITKKDQIITFPYLPQKIGDECFCLGEKI